MVLKHQLLILTINVTPKLSLSNGSDAVLNDTSGVAIIDDDMPSTTTTQQNNRLNGNHQIIINLMNNIINNKYINYMQYHYNQRNQNY